MPRIAPSRRIKPTLRMRLHCFQHVAFEGLGSIEPWLRSRSAQITYTKFFETPQLPKLTEIDWLIVLGGPMSVNDEAQYPWLVCEKEFVRAAIDASKIVLGICLGAQMIANVLGAKVFPNREREIGWHPIAPTPQAKQSAFSTVFDAPLEVFQWHGETFELPPESVHLATSVACAHQAFSFRERALGLQFHLETTQDCAQALVANCRSDLVHCTEGSRTERWVQSEAEIFGTNEKFLQIDRVMKRLLAVLAAL